MAMTTRSHGLNGEQRRALDMLAGSPHGCTEAALRAHGFTVGLLAVRTGLAVARPEIVKAGGRTLSMLRLTITDAGRQEALWGPERNRSLFATPISAGKRIGERRDCWDLGRTTFGQGTNKIPAEPRHPVKFR
jgi:hypothetical protein